MAVRSPVVRVPSSDVSGGSNLAVTAIAAPIGVPADAVDRLDRGDITLVGRMRNASNGTFLVRLDEPSYGGGSPDPAGGPSDGAADDPGPTRGESIPWGLAIYKPVRGERPLWDFEPGLHRRERAAYVLSEWSGLGVVPPTIIRRDAPLGEGSLQWFVNADFSHHYFSIFEQRPDLHDQLRAMAAFDVMVNNTDRKGGHCLLEGAAASAGRPDHVWGIDNGLCFAESFKLRTVIWEFAGDALESTLLEAAGAVSAGAPPELAELLSVAEVDAVQRRASMLVRTGVFPHDHSSHGYPWPLI